jgi:hypothetical protein
LLPELGVELFGQYDGKLGEWRFLQIPIGGFNKKAEILSATEYGKVPKFQLKIWAKHFDTISALEKNKIKIKIKIYQKIS